MSRAPSPGAGASAGARHRRALATVLALVASLVVVEVAAGVWTGSLTLVADAGHMATDALGVSMALGAISAANRVASHPSRTFGYYRWEVLAALANAALLIGVGAFVAVSAVRRLADPPEVHAWPMLAVAVAGLAVTVVAFRLLHAGQRESLNVRGAYLEVLADMIGQAGVIVAAVLILTTGWPYTDAVVALALSVFIAPRAIGLAREALRVLTQAAPPTVDVEALARELGSLPGVAGVHDLHVWTLTSGMDVASVHLVNAGGDARMVTTAAQRVLAGRGLDHATVQVDDEGASGNCSVEW